MRQKIIFIIVLLLIMAALPLEISKNFTQNSHKETNYAKTEQSQVTSNNKKDFSEETLCSLVAALYQEDFSDETLKATAIILHTNYIAKPDSFDFNDTETYIPENEVDNSLRENYNDIRTAVNEVYDKTLCLNGKAFYIPYSYVSDGTTETDKEFSYIRSIASPWDCYSNEYDEDNHCVGISLYGLNYLCKNGYDYSSALKWYLPDFEIK